MKLVNQSAQYISQNPGLLGIYKQIELASRTCYKSENKITDGSAEKMVNALINSKHYAMLEHGTVYLYVTYTSPLEDDQYLEKTNLISRYTRNKYSIVKTSNENNYQTYAWITTNYRVIIENNWENDLKYICEPTSNYIKRYSVRVETNLQVSHELVRHRDGFSFAMESSRYCNYSKDKFGSELTFIKPCWDDKIIAGNRYDQETANIIHVSEGIKGSSNEWIKAMTNAEYSYLKLLDLGWKPQQAAQVLPKALKTELVITADENAWLHFFDLRFFEKTGPVHPQMKELAILIKKELNEFI